MVARRLRILRALAVAPEGLSTSALVEALGEDITPRYAAIKAYGATVHRCAAAGEVETAGTLPGRGRPLLWRITDAGKRRAHQPLIFGLQTSAGVLSFSALGFELLGKPQAVVLLHDKAARLVGLRAVGPHDPNAYRVHVNGQNRTNHRVHVDDFLRHYGIAFHGAVRFPAHDYGDGVHGFALSEACPARQGGSLMPMMAGAGMHVEHQGQRKP
jgi:hypothetical protein